MWSQKLKSHNISRLRYITHTLHSTLVHCIWRRKRPLSRFNKSINSQSLNILVCAINLSPGVHFYIHPWKHMYPETHQGYLVVWGYSTACPCMQMTFCYMWETQLSLTFNMLVQSASTSLHGKGVLLPGFFTPALKTFENAMQESQNKCHLRRVESERIKRSRIDLCEHCNFSSGWMWGFTCSAQL